MRESFCMLSFLALHDNRTLTEATPLLWRQWREWAEPRWRCRSETRVSSTLSSSSPSCPSRKWCSSPWRRQRRPGTTRERLNKDISNKRLTGLCCCWGDFVTFATILLSLVSSLRRACCARLNERWKEGRAERWREEKKVTKETNKRERCGKRKKERKKEREYSNVMSITGSPSLCPWSCQCSRKTSPWRAARRWRQRWTWKACRRSRCWRRSSETSPRSRTPPGRDMRVKTDAHKYLTYTIDFWRVYIYIYIGQLPDSRQSSSCFSGPAFHLNPLLLFFFIPWRSPSFPLYPPQFPLSFFLFPLRWDINLCIFVLWRVLISPPLLVLSL